MKRIALLLLVAGLTGCATPAPAEHRYLTAEEDAQLRKTCEPVEGGCVMVPAPVWAQIEEIVRRVVRGDIRL